MARRAPRSPRNFSSVLRQAAVAVGEVGAQGLLERLGGLLVDRFGLADELLELGPDDVHVDRDAGILEGQQADPDGALDQVGSVVGAARSRRNGSQGRVADDQALDDDPVASSRTRVGGVASASAMDDGERREDGGFHGANLGRAA